MKIGVLGGGNMGGAIAAATALRGVTAPENIIVSHLKKGLILPQGVRTTRDNTEAVCDADIIILGVKPWLADEVLRQIAPHLDPARQSIVSVVAEYPFTAIAANLGSPCPALFRVIPNTALSVGRSVTFISPHGASDAQRSDVLRLFGAMGSTFEVAEEQIRAGMALASCGLAYAMRYIDAAARGGVALGMSYPEAQQIVMDTLDGALALLRTNGTAPQTEIDKVTTPGGITLRGLDAMEQAGFSDAVAAGLKNSK